MLTKKTKEVFPATLTIVGQGESVKFDVVYRNRAPQEARDKIASDATVAQFILWLCESIEMEYDMTEEGLAQLDEDRPGVLMAIWMGYFNARKVQLEKN